MLRGPPKHIASNLKTSSGGWYPPNKMRVPSKHAAETFQNSTKELVKPLMIVKVER